MAGFSGNRIMLDLVKVGFSRRELVRFRTEITRELGRVKRFVRNLTTGWKGSSSDAFNASAEIVMRKLASVILEYDVLLEKLDFAVEASRQTESRMSSMLRGLESHGMSMR